MKTIHLLIVIAIISFCIVSVNQSYSLCMGTFQPNIQKDNGMDIEGYHTYLASINDNQTYPIKYKISSGAVIEAISSETPSPILNIIVREVSQGGNLTIQLPTKLLGLYSIGGYSVAEGAMCADIIGTSFPTPIESNLNFTTVEFPLMNYSGVDEMIYITGNYQQPSTTSESPSPLKQFKSGIAVKNVICNEGLQLIIKAEDGSPACVKPDTAQKLMEKGWTREVGTSNLDVDSACNGTTILSPNYHAMMFPVLLMQSNSTSCVKLTYTVIRPYGVHEDGVSWPRNETISLQISDLNYEGNANEFGITQGKDYTNSFNITAFPKIIDHANYPVGSNFTVTYLIRSLPNATGFYDQSVPMPLCFRYPLAVGHTAEQVNSSDFSKDLFIMLNHSCMRGQDELVGVEVKGMSYTEMKLGG